MHIPLFAELSPELVAGVAMTAVGGFTASPEVATDDILDSARQYPEARLKMLHH